MRLARSSAADLTAKSLTRARFPCEAGSIKQNVHEEESRRKEAAGKEAAREAQGVRADLPRRMPLRAHPLRGARRARPRLRMQLLDLHQEGVRALDRSAQRVPAADQVRR